MVVIILVAVGESHTKIATHAKGAASTSGTVAATIPASILHEVENVPPSLLNQAGIGGQPVTSSTGNNVLNRVEAVNGAPSVASAAVPAVDGKPQIFFLGAEFCPYCATLRWSLIIALSRFGTFAGLLPTASTSPDPVVQTFTFLHATYSSPYVAFEPVEVDDQNRNPLQRPTAAEMRILGAWDNVEEVPWLDIAGRYIGDLAAWDDPVALVGLSRSAIAHSLSEAGTTIATNLDAAANYITAGVCGVDSDQPASVCSSSGVIAAKAQLRKAPAATALIG